jgi:hypothetical protein
MAKPKGRSKGRPGREDDNDRVREALRAWDRDWDLAMEAFSAICEEQMRAMGIGPKDVPPQPYVVSLAEVARMTGLTLERVLELFEGSYEE